MKNILLFTLFAFLFVATSTAQEKNNLYTDTKLTYKIIDGINGTFGYDIFSNNKLMIHQPSIPGISGNVGFKTKPAAKKVAELVISKIKKGEMPPTINNNEMKKLKAIN